MNLHRRHLSQAAKAEVVGKVLKATPKKSDRAIGRLARVDGKTVAARRAELEASAEIPHFETREDSKGHSRPAHKAPASASRAADIEAAEKELADYKTWNAQGAKFADEVSDDEVGVAIDVTECAEPAFGVLRDGDIHGHLNELLGMLRDEKERIAALPTSQRESLARGFLAVLDFAVDDLRPVAGVPVFEGALQ
jgi:hypothetical protein